MRGQTSNKHPGPSNSNILFNRPSDCKYVSYDIVFNSYCKLPLLYLGNVQILSTPNVSFDIVFNSYCKYPYTTYVLF